MQIISCYIYFSLLCYLHQFALLDRNSAWYLNHRSVKQTLPHFKQNIKSHFNLKEIYRIREVLLVNIIFAKHTHLEYHIERNT